MSNYSPSKYQLNKHKYQTPEYKAKAKAWRENNKEHLKDYNRKWYVDNKDWRRKYIEDHREIYRDNTRRWQEANRGKTNADIRLANGLCYQCENVRLENSKKFCFDHWLSEKASYHLGSRSKETRQALSDKLEACNYTCPYTGEKLIPGLNCSLDHIFPSSRFPELATSLDNVEWVTYAVNKAKQDMTKSEFVAMCKTVASRY